VALPQLPPIDLAKYSGS
jgi:hypothetical protein